MLNDQDRFTGYWNSLVANVGAQGSLTPIMNPNINNLPEGADSGVDWDFDGAIGGESA